MPIAKKPAKKTKLKIKKVSAPTIKKDPPKVEILNDFIPTDEEIQIQKATETLEKQLEAESGLDDDDALKKAVSEAGEPCDILLVVKNGILKQIKNEESIKLLLGKNNWDYRLTTADDKITLIDYDKDQGRFYVKALLAKVNKLKEVKMLWGVIFFLLLLFIMNGMSFVMLLYKIGDTQKILDAKLTQTTIPQPLNPRMPAIESPIKDRPDVVIPSNDSGTGQEIAPNFSNRLFKPNN